MFGFFGIVMSVAFLAVGILIAFWPATYLRWVHWSKVESYAPWLVRHLNQRGYHWKFRIVGIWLALFGLTAGILTVWISWLH
jgi:hypothetical protein